MTAFPFLCGWSFLFKYPMNGKGQKKGIWEVRTEGPNQTLALGRILGGILPEGSVIALIGDLGSGKTVLAKGIAQGLGIEDEREVTSPTFVLVNEYQGRILMHHVDLYRLHDSSEVEDLGWEELVSGAGVTLIEWAEKVSNLLPAERVEIHLHWVSDQGRRLIFTGKGRTAQNLVGQLQQKWMEEE